MFKAKFLSTTAVVCLMQASPVFADAQTSAILEEYFDLFKTAPVTIDVGEKDDGNRFTQWNDITVKSETGDLVVNIPWIKVSSKLLGGLEMTYAEEINGMLQGLDEKVTGPVKFVVISKDAVVGIDGDADARSYTSTFDEVTFKTVGNDDVSVEAKIAGATGTQTITKGAIDTAVGDFSIATMDYSYKANVGEQILTATGSYDGIAGKFEIPLYTGVNAKNFTSTFDVKKDIVLDYSIEKGSAKTLGERPNDVVEVIMTHGAGFGTFSLVDTIVEVSGTTKDISYGVSAPAMGFPPVQLDMKEMIAKVTVPLDNVEEAKASDVKIAMTGLTVSDDLWNLFDPQAIIPRDEIDLDVDLTADVRWLKKLADIDVEDKNQTPPVAVERAKINALNLRVAGAELETDGAVVLDNSKFPPVPDGTVNVSLKGAQALLAKLSETGLLPLQNAVVVQGMSTVFFTDKGDDHLVSTVELDKSGRITANGIPVK